MDLIHSKRCVPAGLGAAFAMHDVRPGPGRTLGRSPGLTNKVTQGLAHRWESIRSLSKLDADRVYM